LFLDQHLFVQIRVKIILFVFLWLKIQTNKLRM